MPLRDFGKFHKWLEDEKPSPSVRSRVRAFIAELGDESWRAPSAPLVEESDQPHFEVRLAELTDADGTCVVFRHWYATDDIDILYVGPRQPPFGG